MVEGRLMSWEAVKVKRVMYTLCQISIANTHYFFCKSTDSLLTYCDTVNEKDQALLYF